MARSLVYQAFAKSLDAFQRCRKLENEEWADYWEMQLELLKESLPNGSGIDGETEFDYGKSNANKLVFHSSYHAMDENGFYTRWYDFIVIVTPSLIRGFDLRIKGTMPAHLRDYLQDLYANAFADVV